MQLAAHATHASCTSIGSRLPCLPNAHCRMPKLYNNYSSLCNFCYSINCVKSLCTHLLDLLGPSTEITKSRSCELPHQKHFAFSNKHLRQATKKLSLSRTSRISSCVSYFACLTSASLSPSAGQTQRYPISMRAGYVLQNSGSVWPFPTCQCWLKWPSNSA